MPNIPVDFVAAGRIAKRAELKSIRVIEISASCDPKIAAPLEPEVHVECSLAGHDTHNLEIICDCQFIARTTQAQVAQAKIKYLLAYEIQGTDPLAPGDVSEFTASNGRLNSWPFLRELLHGLTTKMGYPAYLLPMLHFVPKPQANKVSPQKPTRQAETSTVEPRA